MYVLNPDVLKQSSTSPKSIRLNASLKFRLQQYIVLAPETTVNSAGASVSLDFCLEKSINSVSGSFLPVTVINGYFIAGMP